MDDFMLRVAAEKAELDAKIKALKAFLVGAIFDTLLPVEQGLLKLRVAVEKAKLDAKIKALKAFLAGAIFDTLLPFEQGLLKEQLGHMEAYSDVLQRRIERWP